MLPIVVVSCVYKEDCDETECYSSGTVRLTYSFCENESGIRRNILRGGHPYADATPKTPNRGAIDGGVVDRADEMRRLKLDGTALTEIISTVSN